MKFKQKLVENIITVDDEYAFLESMDDGICRYLVRFFVNPQLALSHGSQTINLYISKNPNIETNIPIFNTTTPAFAGPSKTPLLPSDTVQSLLKKGSVIKDTIRATNENNVMDFKVDFTNRMSNELGQQFAKKDLSNPITVKTIRNFTTAPVDKLKGQNINLPVLENSIASVTKNVQDNDNSNIKKLSNQFLSDKGIDPSSIFVKQNAIKTSEKTFGGIAQKINNIRLDSLYAPILTSVNGSVEKPKISTLPPNSIISVPTLVDVTNVLVEEYIDIPFGAINEEFFIILILKDQMGVPVQKLIKNVQHNRNVAMVKTPRIPPYINAIPVGKIGKNTLELKQLDRNAFGINLYRKIIQTNISQNNSEYTFVGKVPLTVLDGRRIIDDYVSNGNQIIYRAVAYGEDELNSAEFSSVVTKPVKMPNRSVVSSKNKNHAGMIYEFTNSGINIELTNIPSGPISVSLFRKDLTSKQDYQYVDKPRLLNGKGSENLVFKDSLVSKGRIYQYYYKFTYKDGSEQFGSNCLVIEYTPETSNIVSTTIGNPKIVQKGTEFDVEFTLESSFVNTGEDEIRKTLAQQGLSDFFSTSLDAEKMQNLIAYEIIRNNLTTGEIENFGIVTDRQFSDIKLGKIKGVKPVKNGNEYEYSVATYFRNPISLMKNYVKSYVDEKNSQKNYSFQPYFWLHPVTLTEGNLITERTLNKNHSKTQFSFGEVGNITKTTVSLADTLPSIYDGLATKINSKLIKIQWKIQGTATKIDHFIITLDILGMKTVVGKAHNITDSNMFEFYDELTNGEKGALSYTIIPVYYDYSRGKKIVTNKVLV